MSNERATAHIDKSKNSKYNTLVDTADSLFYKNNKSDVYIIAATIGFYYHRREKIAAKQDLFVSTTLGKGSEENSWILKSLAIATEGIDILGKTKEIYQICDEYANYGIDVLYQQYLDADDKLTSSADLLMDKLDEFGLLDE